jgi:transposase-like protein
MKLPTARIRRAVRPPTPRQRRRRPGQPKMGKAADSPRVPVHATLTRYGFPDIHWQKIRTKNPQEQRDQAENRAVGAFPDGQSCLNLAAARLRHVTGTRGRPAPSACA